MEDFDQDQEDFDNLIHKVKGLNTYWGYRTCVDPPQTFAY